MNQATRTRTSPEVAAALALPIPPPAPPMPPARLAVRLRTAPRLRRLLPTRLVIARSVHRAGVLWQQGRTIRAEALGSIETIVGSTRRAGEVPELARAHFIEKEAERALFWQPWVPPALDPPSRARVCRALRSERGLLFSSCHHGPYFLTMSAIAALGPPPFSVGGAWLFEQPSHDYWGRRLARWWQGACTRVIRSGGSFAVLEGLLARGESAFIMFDMPGHHDTRFLGKPATLADGTARLALASDALILPLRVRRVGHRASLDVGAPLDPGDYAGVEELQRALARWHEDWILELPETMDDPRQFGWGDGAGRDAWVRRAAG